MGIQPNMNCFGNPAMNFLTGMGTGMSAASNPFAGGSLFGFGFPAANFPTSYNPFMFNIFANPFMGGMNLLPTFQLPFFNWPFSFSSSTTVKTEGKDNTDYSSSTSSKIKPGLLKGNLKGKEAYITSLCEKYRVDVGVVLSIIGQESGFGTSRLAKHNNFMGYRAAGDAGKSSNGYGYFSTPEKGLETAIKNLAAYPRTHKSQGVKKVDFNNIDAIGRVYCEGTTYANSLRHIYRTTVKKYLV